MNHRSEVDGLRALAVVPVILFHAGFGVVSGGFAGVDVFFVISGYLITYRLVADLRAGRFSLADFYARRVRRILPALWLVTAVSLPLSWLWLLPADLNAHARSVLAVLGFASNLLFWRESGYFSPAAELRPLLHTWSLAVEEQFYLLFPLLLLLVWRLTSRPGRLAAAVIGGLCLLSLAGAHWGATHARWAAFYLLPTRAWELGVGALVALHQGRPLTGTTVPRVSALASGWAAAGGLAMVLASMVMFDRNARFPGLPALLPTLGTALLLLHAGPGNRVGRLLAWPPLVAVGLVSYSAYLWHQPLLALARQRSLESVGPVQALALCLASLVLAALTWRYAEQPCRDRRRVGGRTLALGLVVGALAMATVAVLLLRTTDGQGTDGLRITEGRCNHGQERCYERAPGDRQVALWGDSHADVLAMPLGELLNARGVSLQLQVMPSCPSIPGTLRDEPRRLGTDFAADCARHNRQALDSILQAGVQDLVLVNAFQGYMTTRNADGSPTLIDPEHPGDAPARVIARRLAELVALAQQRGIRVVLVTPHPRLRNPAQVRKELHRGLAVAPDFDLAGAAQTRASLLADLAPLPANLVLVEGDSLYCRPAGCRALDPAGLLVLHDGSHLAPPEAARLAGRIADIVAPAGSR